MRLIPVLVSAMLASNCANVAQPPTAPIVESRPAPYVAGPSDTEREPQGAHHLVPAHGPIPDEDVSHAELARLERQLAETHRELARRGDQTDAQTQALRDREVALEAKIDRVFVLLDRAEHHGGGTALND